MRSVTSMLLVACSVICAGLQHVARAQEDAKVECQSAMKTWIDQQRERFPDDRPADPHKMLYFLHVPRTAGRTTHNCFMMPATPPSRRCAKSYDGLKYDISIPDCGLISSHDDFSAMHQLPATAAVFTSIRNPITRFLSAYEFAVELGARDAIRGKPVKMGDNKGGKVNTKEVWPWSYLQPTFADDMIPRFMEHRPDPKLGYWEKVSTGEGEPYYLNRVQNRTEWEIPAGEEHLYTPETGRNVDAYDNVMYMSLLDFANHFDAHELIHNGQTLQVLGLTNYSSDPEAGTLRKCMHDDPVAARLAVDYAKERLRTFTHVGTFEGMREHLSAFASKMGIDLDSHAYSSNKQHAFSYDADPEEAEKEAEAERFLDEELPQTIPEIQKEVQALNKESKGLRDVMQQPQWNASSPDGVNVTERQEAIMAMRERLQQQMLHIKAGRKIVNRLEATGRARQLVPDSEHITNRTIAENFANCESNAQSRAHSKRRGVMAKLKREDGGAPQFSRNARRAIPGDVLKRIRAINWMDMELHELATAISSETITNERGNGMKELKKGQMKRPQQSANGAGADNVEATRNDSAPAGAPDAVAGQGDGVGDTDKGGETRASDGSISDAETASVSSFDSVKDEL
eukprot:jgi/Ulvmu1/7887/UM004_0118.1